jgi:hypothetical protein
MCYRISILWARILVECKFRGEQFIVNRGQNDYSEANACQKAFGKKTVLFRNYLMAVNCSH